MSRVDLVLHDVEVGGQRRSVTIVDGRIAAVEPATAASRRSEATIDGGGAALLPGLHDHHLHLLALAAWRDSVDCSTVDDEDELVARLRGRSGEWVRAVGYHESLAGVLDRNAIDRWVPDRPVRIQHRGGALWMLNSAALERVEHVLDDTADVERDDAGIPTGRLWRYDARLRPALPSAPPNLRETGAALCRTGLTGLTDATPDLDAGAVELLRAARVSGDVPQSLVLLGTDAPIDAVGLSTGPRKIVIRDHDLPSVEHLTAQVVRWHALGRPVALHTVSAEALVLALAAIETAGPLPGDRLEHAAVVPAGLESWLRSTGVVVVTQPALVHSRGDSYLQHVAEADRPFLYRYASLLDHGIPVVASSDAPYGEVDPWAVIRAARDRQTTTGQLVGPTERVTPLTALTSYLRDPLDLTAPARQVAVGAPAALCLLHVPLVEALAEPSAELVRAVALPVRGGTRLIET